MEKIIDVAAYKDTLRILKWGNHLNRESALELAIKALEEATRTEIVRCKDCERRYVEECPLCYYNSAGTLMVNYMGDNFYCEIGRRRDSDD